MLRELVAVQCGGRYLVGGAQEEVAHEPADDVDACVHAVRDASGFLQKREHLGCERAFHQIPHVAAVAHLDHSAAG